MDMTLNIDIEKAAHQILERVLEIAEEPQPIKINLHGNPPLEQHGEWIDLYCADDVYMKAGDSQIINLGVAMELPKGFYAEVAPRSSMFRKHGILMTNSPGVIEIEYKGDNDIWGLSAYATRDTHIPKHTRLCQFRLVRKAPRVIFQPVESLGNPDRGGFGSTGTQVTK